MRKRVAYLVVGLVILGLGTVYFCMNPGNRNRRSAYVRAVPSPIKTEEAAGGFDAGRLPARAADPGQPPTSPALEKRVHPLLAEADEVVLIEGPEDRRRTPAPELAELIRSVAESARGQEKIAALTVDYPQDGSLFPPEFVSPTFLWHEPAPEADTWLIDVTLKSDESGEGPNRICVLSPGNPPPPGEIDPDCVTENNEIYKPTPYQASARSWTPGDEVWSAIKGQSAGVATSVTILGFNSAEPREALSRGRVTIATSPEPVGAPIFYRDVPLAPSRTQEGVIKPLGEGAVTLIAWRLRDVSKPRSRLLLTDVPTCTNCHSFSADGGTLGMDLDGPQGDKGAYLIAPVTEQTVVRRKHVISWNAFQNKPKDHKTIGFLSQVSPDGQYVVTTLNEALFVCNFMDYKFLQVFYPTRGILGYYSRSTGRISALPGADDPQYVHCDPVWSPDGSYLVFARAEAKDPYPEGRKLPAHANDPAETPIQYSLYRIPFDAGRGGRAEPIAGASHNGMSNTFPKISPNGKWIVFVKCGNGQLMRPDSELWIVPAPGGTARRMQCNTSRMNSWHSFAPNSPWMVFSSKANTPYTQMFLTRIDEQGNASPAVLIPNSTAANRAVNIPEFVNVPYDGLMGITMEAVEYLKRGLAGVELARQGKLAEAMEQFDIAVQLEPDYLEGHVNAAVALLEQGMLDEAAARLEKVLEANPNHWHAHGNLGVILARKGMLDQAMAHCEEALRLNPGYLEAHSNMGRALLDRGMRQEALVHFRAAVRLDPSDPLARFDLGNVLAGGGKLAEAAEHFEKAIEVDSRFVEARLMLAHLLLAQRKFQSAADQFSSALENNPDDPRVLDGLAWILATCPEDKVRNGARAVQLAQKACRATDFQHPAFVATLAAAYAEVGRFSEAVATATTALERLKPDDQLLTLELQRQLEHYRQGRPYRTRQSGEKQ